MPRGFILFKFVISMGGSERKRTEIFTFSFTVGILIVELKYCVPQLNIFLEKASLRVD